MKFNGLLVVLTVAGSIALGEINLKVGDQESQIVKTLGKPQGTAEMNRTTLYMYDGGNICAKDGKVVSVPSNFEDTAQRKQIELEARKQAKIRQEQIAAEERERQEKFEAEQRSKGLILYEKQWITPEHKTSLETKALAEKQAALLAAQQEEIARLRGEQSKATEKLQQIEQKQEQVGELARTVKQQGLLLNNQAGQMRNQSRQIRAQQDDLENQAWQAQYNQPNYFEKMQQQRKIDDMQDKLDRIDRKIKFDF